MIDVHPYMFKSIDMAIFRHSNFLDIFIPSKLTWRINPSYQSLVI